MARSMEAFVVVKLIEKGVDLMKREREAESIVVLFGIKKTANRQMYFVCVG